MSSNIISYFSPVLQAPFVTSGMHQCAICLRPILNLCTISTKYRIRSGYAVGEKIFRSCGKNSTNIVMECYRHKCGKSRSRYSMFVNL